jgi:hypothetical protein
MGRLDVMNTARDQARAENTWFVRHDSALRRWPVIGEQWAERLEERRLEATAGRDIAYLHGAGR